MGELTTAQTKAALERGADTHLTPKIIDIPGLKPIIDQFAKMLDSNRKANAVVLGAIQELTSVIAQKDFKGTDVSGLVEAVKGLKHDYQPSLAPDYEISFERDNQRGLMKSPVRFSAIAPHLNS